MNLSETYLIEKINPKFDKPREFNYMYWPWVGIMDDADGSWFWDGPVVKVGSAETVMWI